ncbi:hypothetical protein [Stigmatella erecta]|uniref:Right handed beta helix region n=1 Tax=Stigmatella erecta TaxID=83460 RepID=A0A1I0KDC2_9BACT|nr:hypothetical protein [Stigmatella erecta]SEU22335.1 hypothetical protein SAMN05443639_110120 [Stigmatella erecta]
MKRNKAWMSVLLPAVLALGACEGEDKPPSPGEGGPTVHAGFIKADETWRAAGNPHVVRGPVLVGGSQKPVLTVEAGVEIRFERKAGLMIGTTSGELGALRVEGTEAAPVLFTASAEAPQPGDWLGVTLGEGTQGSRISHATIEYAGGIFDDGEENSESWKLISAGLHLVGGPEAPEDFRPAVIEHVTLQRNAHHGVLLTKGGFAKDSLGLTLRDNAGVALRSTANEVGTLPQGTTVGGNTVNEIHVVEGPVTTSQTWPNVGVPYVLTQLMDLGVPPVLFVGSASAPVLTLSPGTELRIPGEGYISIGFQEESGTIVPGNLQAVGTAQAPIRFGPTGATAFWSGLFFYGAQDTSLEYVTVAQAGKPLFGALGGGNLNVNGDLGVSVRRSTLSGSAGCGITVTIGLNGSATDYVAEEFQNVFTGNAGGAQCNR